MTKILAIDPGSTRSAWFEVVTGLPEDLAPIGMLPCSFGIDPNDELVARLRAGCGADVVVTEWMSPRGLPTSAQEMETMWWAGRFAEAAHPLPVERLSRDEVKYRLCGRRAKVTDTNVRAALIDRFGGIGGRDVAVGRKASPGPLYGVSEDAWAALAVAVTYADGAS